MTSVKVTTTKSMTYYDMTPPMTVSVTSSQDVMSYIIVRFSHLYVAIYISLLLYMQVVLRIGRHLHSRYLLDYLA